MSFSAFCIKERQVGKEICRSTSRWHQCQLGGAGSHQAGGGGGWAGDAAGGNRREGGEEQEPCCQEEQSRLNFSAIEGSDPNSCRFHVYQVRVDREDEVQEKKKRKESFRRGSKSRSKSKLGEIVAKQMSIVGETNFWPSRRKSLKCRSKLTQSQISWL